MLLLASVKESCSHGPATEGLALLDGEVLALGLSDGDSELLGLTLGEGLIDALSLALGLVLADGDSDGETLGEPTDDTLRSSMIPPTLGEAVLRVNEPLATVVMASNT